MAFDTITDLLFFWLGAFSASLLFAHRESYLVLLAIIVILLVYPISYWFLTKMYLQIPQYPFQFRLSQWDVENLNGAVLKKIRMFLQSPAGGKHLLIFGTEKSGKTSLGVGIATELSIRHRTCVYLTAIKLYALFFRSESQTTLPWDWRNSSLLVIDDINPGNPVKPDLVTPVQFLKLIDTYKDKNEQNRERLRTANAIWLLGSSDITDGTGENWEDLLREIGVRSEDILTIHMPEMPDSR